MTFSEVLNQIYFNGMIALSILAVIMSTVVYIISKNSQKSSKKSFEHTQLP